MKIAFKIIGIVLALVIVVFAGLSIFIATLDADKYRPQLVQTLSDKTGRKIVLNGAIKFSFGIHGVNMSIQDVSIGNPTWASRPIMASMGKFEVGVGLMPLLSHQLEVKKLTIVNADILLETNAAGQHNWDFGTANAAVSKPVPQAAQATASSSEQLNVGNLSITDSQLAMRGPDGKTALYSVESLTLDMQGAGAVVNFKGNANGAPLTLAVKTGITDLLSRSAFPFDADLTYGAFHVTATGKADMNSNSATIDSYQLVAGKTTLTGNASAAWGGAHPVIQGKMESEHIDPADFKISTADASGKNNVQTSQDNQPAAKRMFSDAPLPLGGLKAVNANLQINAGEMIVGQGTLKNVAATLTLTGGNLSILPIKATVGGKAIDAQLRLDASQSPAHLSFDVKGDGVDLSELQKLGNMKPFMTGTAGAVIQVAGTGDSAHAIASSLNGVITITAEKGEILGGAASGISSTLAAVFAPKGNDSAINCLAVRFIAKGGMLANNGMLIDSAASTVNGKGNVNLASEVINLTLYAKTKLVDIGGLVPSLAVGGTLSKPSYSVDAVGAVKSLVGNLVNGDVSLGNNTVPDIQTPPAGQNACVFTLDHPKAAASSDVLPADIGGKASQKIRNIGNSLLKGLFGQ